MGTFRTLIFYKLCTYTARLPLDDVRKNVFRVKYKIANGDRVENPKKRVYREGVRKVRERCVKKMQKKT